MRYLAPHIRNWRDFIKLGLQNLKMYFHVEYLVTDRHEMVKRFMRKIHGDKNHFVDV